MHFSFDNFSTIQLCCVNGFHVRDYTLVSYTIRCICVLRHKQVQIQNKNFIANCIGCCALIATCTLRTLRYACMIVSLRCSNTFRPNRTRFKWSFANIAYSFVLIFICVWNKLTPNVHTFIFHEIALKIDLFCSLTAANDYKFSSNCIASHFSHCKYGLLNSIDSNV